jgi:hypothetical protein
MTEQERIESKIKEMPNTKNGHGDLKMVSLKLPERTRSEMKKYPSQAKSVIVLFDESIERKINEK